MRGRRFRVLGSCFFRVEQAGEKGLQVCREPGRIRPDKRRQRDDAAHQQKPYDNRKEKRRALGAARSGQDIDQGLQVTPGAFAQDRRGLRV